MKNKMIATLLMVVITASVSFTCNTHKAYAEVINDKVISSVSQIPSLSEEQSGYSLLEQRILENINKESQSFSIECTSNGIGITSVDKVIQKIIYRLGVLHPESTYNLKNYALEARMLSSGNIAVTILPSYSMDANTKKDLDNRIKAILGKILKDNMSEQDKELAIHDWIVDNIQYDETYTIHDPYNTLIKHTGVCEGYALLAQRMFTLAGIECIPIVGSTGDKSGALHEWNMVHIEGKWYHVDCTWDDPTYKKDDETDKYKREYRKYKYYNESDKFMQKSRTWDTTVYPNTN